MAADNDCKWLTDSGIKFSIATLDDAEEINSFLLNNCAPDEPITRCIGISQGDGLVDKYGRYLFFKELVKDPLKQNLATVPCSIVARSATDTSIVGCRMGAIYNKNSLKTESFVPDFLGSLPKWFGVPEKFIHGVNLQALHKDLSYSQNDAFNELEDSGDVIYFANVLCVSKQRRGEGLGAELLKRAYRIAVESGCKYTYVLVTGIYSQNVVHRLGGTKVLHEVHYEDYKTDGKGRPFLTDTREHKVAQVLAVDHNKVVL